MTSVLLYSMVQPGVPTGCATYFAFCVISEMSGWLNRRFEHAHEVARRRSIAGVEADRILEVRRLHAELFGLGVHRRDQLARIEPDGAPERGHGAVVRRHQRRVQQIAVGERHADGQARARAAEGDLLVALDHRRRRLEIELARRIGARPASPSASRSTRSGAPRPDSSCTALRRSSGRSRPPLAPARWAFRRAYTSRSAATPCRRRSPAQ